jgi:drug/metabolite transporter (DMT)-like permease
VGLSWGPSSDEEKIAYAGWIGELSVLASALCAALRSVFYRPYLGRYPTLQVSAFAMFASVVFLAFVAVLKGHLTPFSTFTASGWVAVVYIGAGSAVGYFLWLWALGHSTLTRVTIFLSLGPITSAALGAVLLAEPVSAFFVIGLSCVILGL